MPNKLFRRRARLTFGKRGETGKRVEGLRISFEITATSESSANDAKISVWNLSRESRAIFDVKKEVVVTLEVGYGNKLGQLFSGDLRTSRHVPDGGNTVTILELGDSEVILNTAKVNRSYGESVSVKQIITDAVKTFKGVGALVSGALDTLTDKTLQNGFTASGLTKDIMDILVPKLNGEWSIQNNKLQVAIPLRPIDPTSPGLRLTPRTGLIGSPSKREKGIEFTYLIQSEFLGAGRKVQIESRETNGFFTTRKVTYTGDTHGRAWYAKAEATPI